MRFLLVAAAILAAVPAGAQEKKSEPNAVERGAKRTDKALTNAAEKTDNWVKEKTK